MKTLLAQLSVVAIATTLMTCQALLLKTPSNTWVDALSAHWGLKFVYGVLALLAGERLARYFNNRARIASPTSRVE